MRLPLQSFFYFHAVIFANAILVVVEFNPGIILILLELQGVTYVITEAQVRVNAAIIGAIITLVTFFLIFTLIRILFIAIRVGISAALAYATLDEQLICLLLEFKSFLPFFRD